MDIQMSGAQWLVAIMCVAVVVGSVLVAFARAWGARKVGRWPSDDDTTTTRRNPRAEPQRDAEWRIGE